MTKINKEEYWFLKGLNDGWKWIAKDKNTSLWVYEKEPRKHEDCWDEFMGTCEMIDSPLFQFIQWEDEEPWNIEELIEHYEYWLKLAKNPTIANLVGYDESEDTEVKKDIKWAKRQVADKEFNSDGGEIHFDVIRTDHVYKILSQIDEPEVKDIALQDITHRLWELPSNNRKLWLARLNEEFQDGYIVPLGLKTTDGEEQYLTFNGSYFASRRNKGLQQTFATLEEIPEFYRDLAERVL